MTDKPEFSRLFDVSRLPEEGKTETLTATPQECIALTQRFAVESVHSVTAKLEVQPWKRGGFRVRGNASAVITQQCVVTLEPFDAEVTVRLDRLYVEAPGKFTVSGPEVVVSLDDDDIGQVVDGDIELGELVVEELLLELDPYPRKPGAVLERAEFDGKKTTDEPARSSQDGKINPFAVLKDLQLKKPD